MPHDPSDEEKPHFDEALHAAYLRTEYTCGRYLVKIGSHLPGFDAFLAREGFSTYAFITAWNPRSQALPKADNLARSQKFQLRLEELALDFMPATAYDPTEKWPTEEGVFVFNTPMEVVLELAAAWEQNAVVVGVRGRVPGLVWV